MNKKGFTVIELLATVLILSILMVIALPMYTKALERSRAGSAVSTLAALARAQARFRMQTGHYADDVSDFDIEFTDNATHANATGDTFQDQYFDFSMESDLDNPIATAVRRDVEDVYTLTVNYNLGNVFCAPASNYVCMYLGLPEPEEDDD